MITAKEAREKIDSINNNYLRKEQQKVEKKINKAIRKRKNYCYVFADELSENIEKQLESLGYTIEYVTRSREYPEVKISW